MYCNNINIGRTGLRVAMHTPPHHYRSALSVFLQKPSLYHRKSKGIATLWISFSASWRR